FVGAEAERLGLDVLVLTAPYELEQATAAAREMLSTDRTPTAVFCFSDSIAYGLYAAARELGLTIPRDLSVVGYDNHPMSAVLTPRLTTFDWRSKWLVENAVDMVVEAIGPRRAQRRRFVIEPDLHEGGSTGPPRPSE
ncbi:MAG: substrate-binding domain-containing protein, partial [Solirubrobacteraceae bacterium]